MFKLAVFGSKQRQEKFSLPESSTSPSSAFDTKPSFDLSKTAIQRWANKLGAIHHPPLPKQGYQTKYS
jgi:hypothetical protein